MRERKLSKRFLLLLSGLIVFVTPHSIIAQTVPALPTTVENSNGTARNVSKKPATVIDSKSVITNDRLGNENRLSDDLYSNRSQAPAVPAQQQSATIGQPVKTAVFSLDDCYRLTVKNNTTVKRAQNLINNNIIDRETAKFSLYPSLNYSVGHYWSFGKNIDPVTNSYVFETFSGGSTSLSLNMNLFSAFNRINTIKQTGYIIQSSEYAKKRIEIELLANVTLLYARLLLDREQLKTVRNNIQNTLTEIEIINEKINVGKVTKYESYAFTARLNSHRVDLVTLQTDSLGALGELRQLMNMPYDQRLELASIDTTVIETLSATNIPAREYVESLLASHPAIKQAEMDEQVAQVGIKIVKSSSWPSISIGGNVSSNYNRNQVNSNGDKVSLSNQLNDNLGQYVNLGLRVPIFSQMQTTNRIKKERTNLENSRLAKNEAVNAISRTAMQAINDFNSAKEKYQASKLALEENNLSYEMYKEKYRLGLVSSVELIAISDILNASSLKFLQTKIELFLRYQLLQLQQSYSQP